MSNQSYPASSGDGAAPRLEPELAEFADLARRIAELDPAAHSRLGGELPRRLRAVRETIESRQSKGDRIMTASPRRRALTTFAIAAGLLLALTLSIAPGRSALAAMLRQIGLIRVTDEPTVADELDGQPMPFWDPEAPAPTPLPAPTVLSDSAAEQAFGAAVYEPGWLPAGFGLQVREVLGGAAGATALAFYTNPAQGGDTGPAFVKLSQTSGDPAQASSLAIGQAPTSDVTVRGQAGLWVDQAALMFKADGAGNITGAGINLLIWSEGANTFVLESNQLGQADLLAIAEALQP
ncbi:MAG TPA: hypothetical protein VGE07_27260 [Herpetosiphonaceae bacterium]